MDDWLRRLRGLAGLGVTWGIAWGAIGALVGLVIGVVTPGLTDYSFKIQEWALAMAAYGAISGVGFGGVLALRERSRTVDQMSPIRAGAWGILGAVAVPVLFGLAGMFEAGTTALDVIEAMGLTAVLGGTFASGSVAIARRAPDRLIARGSAGALSPGSEDPPDPSPL